MGRGEDSKKNISRFLLELKDTHVCDISLTIVFLADGVLYPWFTPKGVSKGLALVRFHIIKKIKTNKLDYCLSERMPMVVLGC